MTYNPKARGNAYIVLQINNGKGWGDLQREEYIPGDKFKTHKAALKVIENARDRWRDRYVPFRDAKFRVMDTAKDFL